MGFRAEFKIRRELRKHGEQAHKLMTYGDEELTLANELNARKSAERSWKSLSASQKIDSPPSKPSHPCYG